VDDLTRVSLEENSTMLPALALIACARPIAGWTRARLASSLTVQRVLDTITPSLALLADCRVPMPVPIPVPRRPRAAYSMFVTAIAAASALSFDPGPAFAADNDRWSSPQTRWESSVDGQLVDVGVRVDGRSAPLYMAPGKWDRRYFQAFRGRNYAIAVRNNTGRRVGVLLAVDGLNVVTGQRSSLSRNESMYVLDPYEETTIQGWRTSLHDVRRFVFVDEERSYAERTGQANGDMGWIRVLAFREQGDRGGRIREGHPGWNGGDEIEPYGALPAPEVGRDRVQKSAPNESRLHAENERGDGSSNPGTGWGDRRWDPVNRTWFTPERHATDRVVLRYEYASALRALGIEPVRHDRGRLWERERGELGFSQPPRW
jgi:hypothetical protein